MNGSAITPTRLLALLSAALIAAGVGCAAGKPHWTYEGDHGPDHWGRLSEEFALCEQGTHQSPINVTKAVKSTLPKLTFAYQASPFDVEHNGHTVQANYAPGSTTELNGARFELKQFHFHSPSEHLIDGKAFPLEAHFVHANAAGELAVVAVMFEEGSENDSLAELAQKLPGTAGKVERDGSSLLNAQALLPQTQEYYSFIGSLTTPPCTEGVRWIVMKEPLKISAEQLDRFRTALGHANNRPIQPVNDRDILE